MLALDKFGGKINKVIMDGLTAGLANHRHHCQKFLSLKAIDDARSSSGPGAQTGELVMKNALDSGSGDGLRPDGATCRHCSVGVKPGQDLGALFVSPPTLLSRVRNG